MNSCHEEDVRDRNRAGIKAADPAHHPSASYPSSNQVDSFNLFPSSLSDLPSSQADSPLLYPLATIPTDPNPSQKPCSDPLNSNP
eukprot:gene15317-biopygen4236